jgi:hypothetical protein
MEPGPEMAIAARVELLAPHTGEKRVRVFMHGPRLM